MRTTRITQSALGATAWVPVDPTISPFSLDINCVCSSNISATYQVQYTTDDFMRFIPVVVTRATTVATLKLTNHGLTTSDTIIVQNTGDSNLDGTFAVASVVDQNTITYTVANTGKTLSENTAQAAVVHVTVHATITGKTATFEGSQATPITAIRLNVTVFAAGYITMILNQGRK